jgi:hypothetical protein
VEKMKKYKCFHCSREITSREIGRKDIVGKPGYANYRKYVYCVSCDGKMHDPICINAKKKGE